MVAPDRVHPRQDMVVDAQAVLSGHCLLRLCFLVVLDPSLATQKRRWI
jgi:hypothetical protein